MQPQVIDCTKNHPLHIVIIIAAYYGLRRSEVIGLKWSAVDFVHPLQQGYREVLYP
ncbi:hypothetical protein [uncultured Ruminococcus sp.]|uniref:hypothetical protein n=1 Tax=uncultured Ruminococcus sp. TaxID=165186 RepID=UPI002602B4CB|nr:hypothetical protein [uncultured Ruminococcus sp.]